MKMTIRKEQPGDAEAITEVTQAAFRGAPYSNGAEALIVNALRNAGQLTISLVALDGELTVGHIALSPITVTSGASGWFGVGPVSVAPDYQQRGVGTLLMTEALAEVQRIGASGCVVLGDPAFYARFGFIAQSGLVLPGYPASHFQALSFHGEIPKGSVRYHDAFLTQPI